MNNTSRPLVLLVMTLALTITCCNVRFFGIGNDIYEWNFCGIQSVLWEARPIKTTSVGQSSVGQNCFVMHSVHEPLLLVPFNCHKKRTPYERTPYDLAGLKTLYLLRKTYNLSVASETLWLYSLSLSHVCFFYKAVESSIFNPSRLSQFQRPKKFRDQLVFIISLSLKTKPHI